MHNITVFIRQNLHFYMARMLQIFFHIHNIARKRGFSFGFSHGKRFTDFIIVKSNFHTFTTAAVFSFNDYRIADFICPMLGIFNRFQSRRTLGNWQPRLFCGFTGSNFISHQTHLRHGRTNKGYTVLFYHFGKISVFRKKAIPWVNCIRAGNNGSGNNRRLIQIRIHGTCRTYAHSLIGQTHMHGVGIGFGVHSHGTNAHFATSTVYS